MPSKISYQTWSGGSGLGDPVVLIGYCKESAKEVLEYVCRNYYIYSYKSLYRPVDNAYPNNVIGLVIKDATNELETNFKGCDVCVNNSITDLDLERAKSKEIRSVETMKNGLKDCENFHLKFLTNQKWIDIHSKEIEEVKFVIKNYNKS